MKFLLVPENNSLSHIAKALAIRRGLLARGHEVLVAVGQRWMPFLKQVGVPYVILPDIQEQNGSGFPAVAWFRDDKTIRDVIAKERHLLESYSPDRVLGLFRFTLKAAAQLAGIPYDSLICGCLLPDACNAYGYASGENGEKQQAELMSGFFRYAGARLSRVMTDLGLDAVVDAREMLLGESTFLWDFPDFFPVDLPVGCHHVGAINWIDWPVCDVDWSSFEPFDGRPLAVLSFGTCVGDWEIAYHIKQILGAMGFHVLLAAGGQRELIREVPSEPWFTVCDFVPLHQLWSKVNLLVSHGGQMTIFEALKHRVPIAVIPFQPEQAHNGVCLEAIGCGRRLSTGQPFLGNPKVYKDALLAGGEQRLRNTFTQLQDSQTVDCLDRAKEQLDHYNGLPNLLPRLEGSS